MEQDGLNLISWQLAADPSTRTALDSYFRLRDPEGFDAAIATIVPTTEGKLA